MTKEKFDLEKIKNTKWQSTFQREIPLIEVYEWAQAYTKDMEKTVGWKFRKVLFISKKGMEQSFRHTDDFLSLHKFLKDKLKKDNNFLFKIGQKINKYLKNWLKICDFISNSNLKKLTNKELLKIYQEFNKRQRLFFSIIQFPVDVES